MGGSGLYLRVRPFQLCSGLPQFKVAARLDPNDRRLESVVDHIDDESGDFRDR